MGQLGRGSSETPPKPAPTPEPGTGSHTGKLRHRGGQTAPPARGEPPQSNILPPPSAAGPPQPPHKTPQKITETSHSFPKRPGGPRRPPKRPEGFTQLLPRLGSQPKTPQKTRGIPTDPRQPPQDSSTTTPHQNPQGFPKHVQKTWETPEDAPQTPRRQEGPPNMPPKGPPAVQDGISQDQWDPRRPLPAP